MPTQQQPKHQGSNGIFRGQSAVVRRLRSVRLPDGTHLVVARVDCYRGRVGNMWEATTNAGKRWVLWSIGAGWRILKTPPNLRRRGGAS